MKKVLPIWATLVWLPASLALAQSAADSKAPIFDPAKSNVKVVFAPQQAPAPSAAAGQRAHVDSQGRLKQPDPEESQALSDQIEQSSFSPQNFVPTYGLGGMLSVKLGDQFLQTVRAVIGPDGKLRFECAPAQQVDQNVQRATPISKSAVKEASDVK